jgi:hydrogenase large subunit
MKLPPEVNLLAVSHYLQALEYQRKANQVVAILDGKTPNIAVGGVANAINLVERRPRPDAPDLWWEVPLQAV